MWFFVVLFVFFVRFLIVFCCLFNIVFVVMFLFFVVVESIGSVFFRNCLNKKTYTSGLNHPLIVSLVVRTEGCSLELKRGI